MVRARYSCSRDCEFGRRGAGLHCRVIYFLFGSRSLASLSTFSQIVENFGEHSCKDTRRPPHHVTGCSVAHRLCSAERSFALGVDKGSLIPAGWCKTIGVQPWPGEAPENGPREGHGTQSEQTTRQSLARRIVEEEGKAARSGQSVRQIPGVTNTLRSEDNSVGFSTKCDPSGVRDTKNCRLSGLIQVLPPSPDRPSPMPSSIP